MLTRAFDGLKKRIANNFLLGLYECFCSHTSHNNYWYSAGLGSVQELARHLPLWAKPTFPSNKLKRATAVEGFTVNSSHVSFFSQPFLRSLALSPPYSAFLSLCVVILPEVQVREGEAVEKHSIPEACHEGIHWVTSASCHTMTNGFAIFCPTGRQQRAFPLSPGGRETTVFLLSLAFAALMRFAHFISRRKLSLWYRSCFWGLFGFCSVKLHCWAASSSVCSPPKHSSGWWWWWLWGPCFGVQLQHPDASTLSLTL